MLLEVNRYVIVNVHEREIIVYSALKPIQHIISVPVDLECRLLSL
jgi:hypothetical protein